MKIGVMRAEQPYRSAFGDVVEDWLDSWDTATDDDQGSFNAVQQGGQIGKRNWESRLIRCPEEDFVCLPCKILVYESARLKLLTGELVSSIVIMQVCSLDSSGNSSTENTQQLHLQKALEVRDSQET